MACLLTLLSAGCKQAVVQTLPETSVTVTEETKSATYFLGINSDRIGIWKFYLSAQSQGSISATSIYSAPLLYPPTSLPILEQALLSQCTTKEESCVIPSVPIEHKIDYLALAPDQNFLAWRDSFSYCPNADCIGYSQILFINLSNNEEHVVISVPYHINADFAHQYLGKLSWSPDGKYIAFLHGSREMGWSRLKILDIRTGDTTTIAENVYKYAWARHGHQIGIIGWEYTNFQRQGFLRVTEPGGSSTQSYYDDWIEVYDMDWSQDGRQIGILARKANKDLPGYFVIQVSNQVIEDKTKLLGDGMFTSMRWSPNESIVVLAGNRNSKLRIVDLVSETANDVSASGDFVFGENPTWSTDGLAIGINTYPPDNGLISNGIAFIDARVGNVVNWLHLNGIGENWIWSKEANRIILNLQNQQAFCMDSKQHGIGIFNWERNTLNIVPFDKQTMNAIETCQIILGEIIQ